MTRKFTLIIFPLLLAIALVLPAHAESYVRAKVFVYATCVDQSFQGIPGVEVTIHGGGGTSIKGMTSTDGWTPPLGYIVASSNYQISLVGANWSYGPVQVTFYRDSASILIEDAQCQDQA